jgi:hypothetical protein
MLGTVVVLIRMSHTHKKKEENLLLPSFFLNGAPLRVLYQRQPFVSPFSCEKKKKKLMSSYFGINLEVIPLNNQTH